jgi:hypothetical protein
LNSRSKEDEDLLKEIKGNCFELVIFDARPWKNAMFNKVNTLIKYNNSDKRRGI